MDNIVVREHGSLGKTGSAGGVLDVDHFMNVECGGYRRSRPSFPQLLKLLISHHAGGSIFAEKDDMTQVRKLGALKFVAALMMAQFRNNLAGNFSIIHVTVALAENQSACFR